MADRNVFRNWYFDEEVDCTVMRALRAFVLHCFSYHDFLCRNGSSITKSILTMTLQLLLIPAVWRRNFLMHRQNNHQGDSQNRPNTHQVGKQLPQQQQPYVVVPADPSSASMRCSICQEKFVSVWDDVLEEWVWRNAVKAPNENRYYHATCFADMVARPEEPGGKKRKAVCAGLFSMGSFANGNIGRFNRLIKICT